MREAGYGKGDSAMDILNNNGRGHDELAKIFAGKQYQNVDKTTGNAVGDALDPVSIFKA